MFLYSEKPTSVTVGASEQVNYKPILHMHFNVLNLYVLISPTIHGNDGHRLLLWRCHW